MCNFTVKANNGKWRPASHPFRLQFHEGTKVKCQELKDHKDFPLHIYNFTSFNDIHNCPDGKSTTDLIDVIGVYNPLDKFSKHYTDSGSTYTNFYIRDIENKSLFCTLWNVYVDQFETYLSQPGTNPVVNHNNNSANLVFWDAVSNRLIGKSAGDFPSHYYDMERLSPSGCPDEIKDLVGREFVFKVDRQSGSPLNGKSYSIGMVSTDQDKIEELKSVGANQSGRQDYNSDEDPDLLFSSPVIVESNITPSSTEDDIIIQTIPSSTLKRPSNAEQHVDSSTQSSTNKKLKGIKIEKPDA
ncbi:unnamed protein product [Cuscuta europaea]|nr:unnamed protein product [Cuscuta europaea]